MRLMPDDFRLAGNGDERMEEPTAHSRFVYGGHRNETADAIDEGEKMTSIVVSGCRSRSNFQLENSLQANNQ